jgi:death on curing protein
MNEPVFLSLDEIIFFHKKEMELSGGAAGIRDKEGIEACVEAPKASFGGQYLFDLFGMAATYISCLTMRHPFIDGNKRTALASALVFLKINGFDVEESHDEELADLVLSFVTKEINKEDMAVKLKAMSVRN